ncbi:hypothetical protein ES703_15584 [subsurface metagenome]
MKISNDQVTFDLLIGGNVQFLIADNYNNVRAPEGAKSIEWMIAGEEALKDILVRIDLRRGDLGPKLNKRLVSERDSLQEKAHEISEIVSRKEKRLIIKDALHGGKGVNITVKTVQGKWRACYPTVNIVIPLANCRKRRTQKGLKYYFKLPVETAIELAYKVLYWITATEISESKGPKTAETILGKITM